MRVAPERGLAPGAPKRVKGGEGGDQLVKSMLVKPPSEMESGDLERLTGALKGFSQGRSVIGAVPGILRGYSDRGAKGLRQGHGLQQGL